MAKFTPPTTEEVNAQIAEKGYMNITAENFISFYAMKGWMIGKNKMVDWKIALGRADKWDSGNSFSPKTSGKKKLFAIVGKFCSEKGCGMPAVWKSTGGHYDHFKCLEHSPQRIREQFE